MGISSNGIVMVQHFPATGDYIVHREGDVFETYSGDDEITDERVNRFIRECLAGKFYHENQVTLATGNVSGQRTIPFKQIVYCKSFEALGPDERNATVMTNINWVLWAPNTFELTVNRGMLGVSKVSRMKDLSDAPTEVRDFMEACTDGNHIALSQHYSEPDRSSGTLQMVNVSEYFFSVNKVIYGFQREHVAPITPAEMKSMGLIHR